MKWLNRIWAEEHVSAAVGLQALLAVTTTRQPKLTTTAKEYVEVRGIRENPTIRSALLLAQFSGAVSSENYGRQDARNLVQTLH